MDEVVVIEVAEQVAKNAAVELAQQMVEEEAEEKAAEERLRKKAAVTKRKEKLETFANIIEDIYLDVFHVGAPFKMVGDPAQLTAWWSKRQQTSVEN